MDLKKVTPIDFGKTIQVGDAEVAADAILYEYDSKYRRKAKARLRNDGGIGDSIRRLRKQRGLRQGDFNTISRREIGRIERGEITKPRRETLRRIAAELGVSVRELADY